MATPRIDLASITDPALRAEFESVLKENAALKKKKTVPLTLKPGKKGGLSLYGLGRFPVTLYKEQWYKVVAAGPEILAFLNDPAHEGLFTEKD